jgi:hypothetical protein
MRDIRDGRPLFVVAMMMALTGAAFFFVFLLDDLSRLDSWADAPWGLILRYIAAMGIGGAIAGALFAVLFGRRGVLGWILAAIGGVLASALAGMFGSAVGLMPDLLRDGWQMGDLIPIAFGLAVVPLAFADWPAIFVAWVAMMALTHLLARRARRPGGVPG